MVNSSLTARSAASRRFRGDPGVEQVRQVDQGDHAAAFDGEEAAEKLGAAVAHHGWNRLHLRAFKRDDIEHAVGQKAESSARSWVRSTHCPFGSAGCSRTEQAANVKRMMEISADRTISASVR